MKSKLVKEYDAIVDKKRRFVLRGLPNFDHFHVKVYKDPDKEEYTLKMEPRVLASLDQLSEKTLKMMDKAIENFSNGIRSEPIDTDEMRKTADALQD